MAGECPVGIFCDLSRAFDCVNHVKLLSKLYSYGVRGVAYDWVASFLNNRKQYVNLSYSDHTGVNKINSDYLDINLGVPQGSVLGPILFLLYTNELDTLTTDAFFVMYADDKSLLISDPVDETLESKCNNVLQIIGNWYNSNSLYFNTEKTQVVRFHNRQKVCSQLSITLNGVDILDSAQEVKFLGVTIDECLNWKTHCIQLIKKLNSLCFLFRNLSSVLTLKQLIMVYHAQVSSRLRYGVCFWGSSTLSMDVFLAQKRILRCIARVSTRQSCRELFKNFNILTFVGVFIYEMSVFIFKNKNNFRIKNDVHKMNTRQKDQFYIPFCKYKLTANSPTYLGLNIFNRLPNDIKLSTSLVLFKRQLNNYLLDKCFYSLVEFYDST